MGKKICVSFIILVMFLGIGGCINAEQPSPTQTETLSTPVPSTPTPSEYVESTLGNFHIALATDELMNKYDSSHEYINDEDGARLIIWTDEKIKDFAFISVDYEGTGDKISYLAGDILFSVDELSPEKPFVVKLMIPGSVLAYGISFLDENGVQRYFAINLDGRGAEEAPPYFLLEFENGGGLLPISPLSS